MTGEEDGVNKKPAIFIQVDAQNPNGEQTEIQNDHRNIQREPHQ